MRILITGHLGQLATDFKSALAGQDLILSEYEDLRLERRAEVASFVASVGPELILNCAAYNRVDQAEDDPETAFAANALGPHNLALAAEECGATLVHFSTDYVFDGENRAPYTEADAPCPGSVYGTSKLAGEHLALASCRSTFVLRVCGLFGYAGSREKGSNFVETILSLARQGKPLKVVDDQRLTPTSTVEIVAATLSLVQTREYGLYHMTAGGECSWYEFARAILEEANLETELSPVSSEYYKTRARRPRYSVLDNARLREVGQKEMGEWREGLRRYLRGRPERLRGQDAV